MSAAAPVMTRHRLAALGAAGVLAAGLGFALLRVLNDAFDADELQHAYLAWMVAGGKVIYRDFWDNHGPLYALMNGGLLQLSSAGARIDILFWCRYVSLGVLAGILALTAAMARQLGASRLEALTGAAITAALIFVQDRAPECRPDTWQNLFWFTGLWLLIAHLRQRRNALAVAAGALMGLALLTNAKAGLGPALILLWYLAGWPLHRQPARTVLGDLASLALGGAVVYALALAYFAAHDAVAAFHAYSIAWNFLYVDTVASGGLRAANISFLLREQWPFLLASAAGLAAWTIALREDPASLPRAGGSLVAVLAVGLGFSLLLDLYFQFFLIFLPLWSVIAARGLTTVCGALMRRLPQQGSWLAAALVFVLGATLLTASWRLTPREEQSRLRMQKTFMRIMLGAAPRSEVMGVIWDNCGGFTFNEPLQFYWGAEAAIGRTAERHTGENPFGQPMIDALERGPVRFIVGNGAQIVPQLPAATQRYLDEHYDWSECLWTRKRP